MNARFEIDNDLDGVDILDIDVFKDDFGDKNVDLFDNNLSTIKDDWKLLTNRERNLLLAMSFDIKSLFLSNEEPCRVKKDYLKRKVFRKLQPRKYILYSDKRPSSLQHV